MKSLGVRRAVGDTQRPDKLLRDFSVGLAATFAEGRWLPTEVCNCYDDMDCAKGNLRLLVADLCQGGGLRLVLDHSATIDAPTAFAPRNG